MEMHHGNYKFREFVPLIILTVLILALTSAAILIAGDQTLEFGMRMFMGFFFLVFGSFKASQPKGFADAYREYDLLAIKSRAYALLYPFIELTLAVLYLWGISLFITNIFTFFLMSFGALGVYKKLKGGEEVPCACLGVVFKIPMTYVTLGEDLLMATMAFIMIIF